MSTLKQRQLSHLNSQLAQLQANLADFNELINVTALQMNFIKKLGLMHGGLFMSSHRVFENEMIQRQQEQEAQESDVAEEDMESEDKV